jgi:hypothetical protein
MAKKKYFNNFIIGKIKGYVYYRSHRKHPIKGRRIHRQSLLRTRPEMVYSKMALAADLAKKFNPVVTTTYELTGGCSPYNLLVKDILTDAIIGDERSPGIDYSKVKVSMGSLLQPPSAFAQSSGSFVHFVWDRYSGLFRLRGRDRAVLVAYCEALQQCIFLTDGPDRITGRAVLNVKRFAGYQVHTWLGFISKDGKRAADSMYTGRVTVK